MTVHFVVVQCIVLDTGSNAVRLYALDVRDDHPAGQIGVFTHVFEVTAVQRSPIDVDTRSEQHIFIAVTGLFTDTFPVKAGNFRIPGGCQAGEGREGHTRVVGPSCLIPFVPKHFRTNTVRAVGGPAFGDSQTGNAGRTEFGLGVRQRNLFFECQPRKSVFHPFFHRFTVVQINRDFLLLCVSQSRQE